jgi:hypothetical protein
MLRCWRKYPENGQSTQNAMPGLSLLHGGGGATMEWVAVRPDDFIDTGDGPAACGYQLYESLQNGIFNAG